MSDVYLYPGTDVLINRLGIQDSNELAKFERIVSMQRARQGFLPIEVTTKGYRDIHRHLFQDIYEWAGEYRVTDISKGGDAFSRSEMIGFQLDQQFRELRNENYLRGLSSEKFVERAAEHICEINSIHPFREGNGRAERAFLDLLARNAGHEIDLTRINRGQWIEASIKSHRDYDYSLMKDVISSALVTREQTRENDATESIRRAEIQEMLDRRNREIEQRERKNLDREGRER